MLLNSTSGCYTTGGVKEKHVAAGTRFIAVVHGQIFGVAFGVSAIAWLRFRASALAAAIR